MNKRQKKKHYSKLTTERGCFQHIKKAFQEVYGIKVVKGSPDEQMLKAYASIAADTFKDKQFLTNILGIQWPL